MDHREAMSRIQQIREHLARAEIFHVYRYTSVAFTGLLGLVGGWIQWRWDLNDSQSFLSLWVVIAMICLIIVAIEMTIRCRLTESVLLRDAAIVACRQFAPCVVAGGLLTLALYRFSPDAIRLLPGLWAILFSLGLFASRPHVPPGITLAASWYLLAGLLMIALAHGPTFAIWPMPLAFGCGQLLTASVLFFSVEQSNETQE